MNLNNFFVEYIRLLANPAMLLIVSGLVVGLILPLKLSKKTIFILSIVFIPIFSIGVLFTALYPLIDFHCSLNGLQAACLTAESISFQTPTLTLTIGYVIFFNILLMTAAVIIGIVFSIPLKWIISKYTGSHDIDEARQYSPTENPDYFQLYESNKNKSPLKNTTGQIQKSNTNQNQQNKQQTKSSFPSIMQKGSNPYIRKP